MKFLHCLPFLAAIFILAGCASAPDRERVSSGTIQASTFSFINPGNRPAPAGTDNREAVHRMIQGSITRNLAGKGVSKVASGGDITVAYLVVVGTPTSTEAISDYFGYTEDTEKLHLKAHDAYTGTAARSQFEAGTLLIDILDGKTNKLLHRNFMTRSLLKNIPAAERSAHVEEAVNTILSGVRITP
jgi:hypothetical protein